MAAVITLLSRVVIAVLPLLLAGQTLAQDSGDPLDVVAATKVLCAQDPASIACRVGQARSTAIVADAVAEAGNTKDRGTFIDPVRALLTDADAEIRTSAAYALAKLQPDGADTPALLTLLRDPISNVRAGAWAAATRSSDPAARLVARRIAEAPDSAGYNADPAAFDPALLGFTLPDGAEYLWVAAAERATGRLDFLIHTTPDQTLAAMAPLSPLPAQPLANLLIADPGTGALAVQFLDPQVYGDPVVLTLPAAGALPQRLIVVYRDLAFAQTGVAVIFADGRSLVPPRAPTPEITLAPDSPADPAALDASMLRAAGFKPDAAPDESDLFMAIVAADGYGAEDYLALYPNGAYAVQAQAYVTGPRLILDQLSYTDASSVTVSFQNLPQGSSANLSILDINNDYNDIAGQFVPDAASSPVVFEYPRLNVGVYLMTAEISFADRNDSVTLTRDFSVEAGMATLATAKTAYAPGEVISVQFSGMSGDSQDYVSTAQAGAPNGSYLKYVYTAGARDGTTSLQAPTDPGSYELRAFFREDETVLRASLPFTVAGAPAPTTAPVAATDQPATNARATLALDQPSYAPGAPITVTYSGMSGDRTDYVATAAAGAPNTSYLAYVYTDGARQGTATLAAPTTPGAYELRAFFTEDETILRASMPFTVIGTAAAPATPGDPAADARATLTLDKPAYAPGAPITVTYSGMFGDRQDYIASAPAGSPNTSYFEYKYTEGALAGSATLTAPTTPGTYEVRAFFKEDEHILRASVTFTVR